MPQAAGLMLLLGTIRHTLQHFQSNSGRHTLLSALFPCTLHLEMSSSREWYHIIYIKVFPNASFFPIYIYGLDIPIFQQNFLIHWFLGTWIWFFQFLGREGCYYVFVKNFLQSLSIAPLCTKEVLHSYSNVVTCI